MYSFDVIMIGHVYIRLMVKSTNITADPLEAGAMSRRQMVFMNPHQLQITKLQCKPDNQLMFFLSSGVSKLFGAQGSPSSGSLLNL